MEYKHDPSYDLARHPTKDTIKMLTFFIEKSMKTQESFQQSRGERRISDSLYTSFHARSIPSISVYAYLTRILKYCPCANECFLALLIYFDRMSRLDVQTTRLQIHAYNIHRLIISGIMVASKLFSDVFFTNTRYAKVGGLPVSELNKLELEFLALNNFSLFISIEELQAYGDRLLSQWTGQVSHEYATEEISPPVRRKARHLSIDKAEDNKRPG
ncbi:cyclin-domain-containing protein [Sporodiniella umbellata]|nr:cyclin-domain-containing protein [Sporodiniella umbellata]